MTTLHDECVAILDKMTAIIQEHLDAMPAEVVTLTIDDDDYEPHGGLHFRKADGTYSDEWPGPEIEMAACVMAVAWYPVARELPVEEYRVATCFPRTWTRTAGDS